MKKLRPLFSKLIPWLAALLTIAISASVAQARSAAALEKALASGDRPSTDTVRDAGRRPAQVLTFLGIGPGMTVVDLIAAGGYYSEALSVAVGASGHVYAQNPAVVLKFREGANEKALSSRLANDRLKNVERLDRETGELGLEPDSIDAALTALNFHDIANGRGPEAVSAFLSSTLMFLKPGGILGVIDHVGVPGNDNKSLHRIPKSDVVKAVKAAGFELVAEGEMLRNQDDDHSQNVFAEGMRGNTDRFVLLLKKPMAGD